jgi:hypothetical protein
MLRTAILAFGSLLWVTAVPAQDIDYNKIDYSKYASPERHIHKEIAELFEAMALSLPPSDEPPEEPAPDPAE